MSALVLWTVAGFFLCSRQIALNQLGNFYQGFTSGVGNWGKYWDTSVGTGVTQNYFSFLELV